MAEKLRREVVVRIREGVTTIEQCPWGVVVHVINHDAGEVHSETFDPGGITAREATRYASALVADDG